MGRASHFTAKNRRQMDINLLIINNGLTPKAATNAVNAKYRFQRDMINAAIMSAVQQEGARKQLAKMAKSAKGKTMEVGGRAIESSSNGA